MTQDKYQNVLGLDDVTAPIYRVFSFWRFCDFLQAGQLTLICPEKWDDPFENFLFSVPARLSNGRKLDMTDVRRSVYGQCWTLNEESDAMWRIYEPGKGEGVKVKTTARSLFDAVHDGLVSIEKHPCVYLGKMQYRTTAEIRQIMANPGERNAFYEGLSEGWSRALLVKRMEFEYEQEIRLIYWPGKRVREEDKDSFCISVDPNELIEEVVLDPRLNKSHFEMRKKFLKHLGYKGPVLLSSLYEAPDLQKIVWDE